MVAMKEEQVDNVERVTDSPKPQKLPSKKHKGLTE